MSKFNYIDDDDKEDEILKLLREEDEEKEQMMETVKKLELQPATTSSEPLNLADFTIEIPEMQSETEQLRQSLNFFKNKIMGDFNFKSNDEFSSAM